MGAASVSGDRPGVDHADSLETAKWRCDEHGPERVWISFAAPRHAQRSLKVVVQRQDIVVDYRGGYLDAGPGQPSGSSLARRTCDAAEEGSCQTMQW